MNVVYMQVTVQTDRSLTLGARIGRYDEDRGGSSNVPQTRSRVCRARDEERAGRPNGEDVDGAGVARQGAHNRR